MSKIDFTPMKNKPETPKVGVGVILINDDYQVLLGKRKGSHNKESWGLPGGHMELGESFKRACKREVLEETGISINNVDPVSFSNDIFPKDGLHYVTLFFFGQWNRKQTPKLMEPNSCYEWKFFEVGNLPEDTWEPIKRAVELVDWN